MKPCLLLESASHSSLYLAGERFSNRSASYSAIKHTLHRQTTGLIDVGMVSAMGGGADSSALNRAQDAERRAREAERRAAEAEARAEAAIRAAGVI